MAFKLSQTFEATMSGLEQPDITFRTKAIEESFVPTAGLVMTGKITIPGDATQTTLYNNTDGGITAPFDHIYIICDKDITVEITDGSGSKTMSLKAGMLFSCGGQSFTDQATSAVDTMVDITNIKVKRNVVAGDAGNCSYMIIA